MIKIKSARDIEKMRMAGKIAARARYEAGKAVRPGITTKEIDTIVRKVIESAGATPSFLNYNGFPGSACISINEEVIHGIPGKRKIREGDIVKIDVGAMFEGFHGDCAATFAAGAISDEAKRLIDVTRQSFYEGIKFATPGNRISDISRAVQQYVEKNGFSVVREFVGHGVGEDLHEAPEVPNYVAPGRNARLLPGMTLAIEPMVNVGVYEVFVMKDGWTVLTADRKLSSHYENSILITDGKPEILTAFQGGEI